MKNNVSIIPAKNENVPSHVQITNQLKELSDSISRGQYELKHALDELGKSKMEISITRHWYGSIDKNSIEKSIQNVYNNLGERFVTCGSAIGNTNENLLKILNLIKLLAVVEKDLYKQIDDHVVSSNELKDILRDWFKQQGIKDEDVKELIETSFARAYTLRDRINVLRHECNTKISQSLERISIIEGKFENVDSDIKELLNKAIAELNDRIEKKEDLLEEKMSILEAKKQDVETLINKSKNELNEFAQQQKKVVSELSDSLKQEFEARKNSLRKMWGWALLSCVAISGFVSFVMVTLCK